jgi:hypothetical protein
MGYTSNIPSVIREMQRIPIELKTLVVGLVTKIIYAIDIGVHEKTPVWSGLAIRNMIWSVGQPNGSQFAEIKSGPVENEGRRSANAAAARQTRDDVLAKVHQNPFGQFWLSNAAHHIYELEMGMLPSPERSRVPPGGMFGLTYAQVKSGQI